MKKPCKKCGKEFDSNNDLIWLRKEEGYCERCFDKMSDVEKEAIRNNNGIRLKHTMNDKE